MQLICSNVFLLLLNVQAASNSMLLQREASALAAQPPNAKWAPGGAVSSEQLSLELHHVEREIGKRTREIAMVSGTGSANTIVLSSVCFCVHH